MSEPTNPLSIVWKTDAPEGMCWQCPDCDSWAVIGGNAAFHAQQKNHGVPKLIIAPPRVDPEDEFWSQDHLKLKRALESRTLAERCFEQDRAETELYETIHGIMGGEDLRHCTRDGFIFPVIDTWTDDYDGSVEVTTRDGTPKMTREQADKILALGFGMIYETPGNTEEVNGGVIWTKTGTGWCQPKPIKDDEYKELIKARHDRDALHAKLLNFGEWLFELQEEGFLQIAVFEQNGGKLSNEEACNFIKAAALARI